MCLFLVCEPNEMKIRYMIILIPVKLPSLKIVLFPALVRETFKVSDKNDEVIIWK